MLATRKIALIEIREKKEQKIIIEIVCPIKKAIACKPERQLFIYYFHLAIYLFDGCRKCRLRKFDIGANVIKTIHWVSSIVLIALI